MLVVVNVICDDTMAFSICLPNNPTLTALSMLRLFTVLVLLLKEGVTLYGCSTPKRLIFVVL